MAKLWETLLRRSAAGTVSRYSVEQYLADVAFTYNGLSYGYGGGSNPTAKTEDIENNFVSYVQQAYKSNGIIFAIMLARMLLFTEARFCWYEVQDDGSDGAAAGRKGLEVLETPWPNGSTAELLARMDQDASFSGNFYAARENNRLRRLRPDWLTIVLTAPPAEAVESDVAGYWYHPGRSYGSAEPSPGDPVYLPDEICHWSPIPDPEAQYRGMSWLTPVLREIQADSAATTHKLKFFENGATLGTIISAKENLTEKQFNVWKKTILDQHQGVDAAYNPLFLASPVDVSIQGVDMKQLDFKISQGGGETRLCADGGVPPIIVGLSEGLASATYSNYGMARRKFGDHWARPMWKGASHALSSVVDPPDGDVRLGVNDKDIAFLREDQKDAAEIQQINATTINSYISAGFTPDSSVAAAVAGDPGLLVHSGLVSVQLQPPGGAPPTAGQPFPDSEPPPDGEPGAVDGTTGEDLGPLEDLAASLSLRADLHPGDNGNQLKHYWTTGEGLAKWAASPHPWTSLYHHLVKHMPPEKAKRVASEWFHEHFGFWPGSDTNRVMHGKPPRGERVGPG